MTAYTLDPPEAPQRWPFALGAIGAYDPGTLERMAAAQEGEPLRRVGAEEGRWALLLDRDACEWRSGEQRGFAWSEGLRAREEPAGWEDASRRWGSCGL